MRETWHSRRAWKGLQGARLRRREDVAGCGQHRTFAPRLQFNFNPESCMPSRRLLRSESYTRVGPEVDCGCLNEC